MDRARLYPHWLESQILLLEMCRYSSNVLCSYAWAHISENLLFVFVDYVAIFFLLQNTLSLLAQLQLFVSVANVE